MQTSVVSLSLPEYLVFHTESRERFEGLECQLDPSKNERPAPDHLHRSASIWTIWMINDLIESLGAYRACSIAYVICFISDIASIAAFRRHSVALAVTACVALIPYYFISAISFCRLVAEKSSLKARLLWLFIVPLHPLICSNHVFDANSTKKFFEFIGLEPKPPRSDFGRRGKTYQLGGTRSLSIFFLLTVDPLHRNSVHVMFYARLLFHANAIGVSLHL